MKVLSYILVMAGLIAAVIAVYLSRPIGVAEARVTVAEIIPAPSAPSPSSDLEQLTNEAKKARSVVTRKLSTLHSEKATSAATFQAYVANLPQLDLQGSKEGLEKAAKAFDTLKKEASTAQDEAESAFSAFEVALSRSLFAALEKPKPQSGLSLDGIIAVVGALVSMGGLVLNWQAFKTEREKIPLEIEKLRQEVRNPKTGA